MLLIVCGSATSWIIDNIVNNTGGLHNRLTDQIQLAPFTLKECEEYFRENGIPLPRYQILESYMVFGGIPYYLDFFEADRSDKIIHLCEMKFSSAEYSIDKAYSTNLRNKRAAFLSETKTRKAAHTTLVTTFGTTQNEYSAEVLFQLTMNDLFG